MGFSGVWCTICGEIKINDEYWLLNISSKNDVPTGIRAKLAFFSVDSKDSTQILKDEPQSLKVFDKEKKRIE